MKLSTKGRYGVKAMFELSLSDGKGPIALNNIAEKQRISVSYLEQLFSSLRKAGLVKSIRGAQGGYVLGKKPKDITVGDIIRTLEGSLAPSDCVGDDESKECNRANQCVTRIVWERIRDSVNDVIDTMTLQDMIDDHNKINCKDH